MDLNKLERSVRISWWLVLATLALLLTLYFTWFVVVNDQSLSEESSRWGEFGDFVGGLLNPLIAIFAIYWLTVSILIQKQELAETRAALEKSQLAQEKQAQMAVTAAKIQSLNMRLSIINSELSAKLEYRNILLSANRPDQSFLNEEGYQHRASKLLERLNPEIEALRGSRTELVRDIALLADAT